MQGVGGDFASDFFVSDVKDLMTKYPFATLECEATAFVSAFRGPLDVLDKEIKLLCSMHQSRQRARST